MVKSLEQYLSDLTFDLPEGGAQLADLNAGEKIFVEKYLGQDALDSLPVAEPQPAPLLQRSIPQHRTRLAEPKIEVAPPRLIVAPAPSPEVVAAPVRLEPEPPDTPVQVVTAVRDEAALSVETAPQDKAAVEEKEPDKASISSQPVLADLTPAPAAGLEALSLKESMRQQEEVQAVSFFVADQLFLLPVEGIQEVLRHMELVRVPQAPPFVAGVINLRGKVTPLIHLSAILTNTQGYVYDPEKNFIIICGSEPLQVGLIIDKINSMHLLPQDKIIWNVEAKLGDAADFLYAIVNLDEKVCGLVAPEMITRKILAAES